MTFTGLLSGLLLVVQTGLFLFSGWVMSRRVGWGKASSSGMKAEGVACDCTSDLTVIVSIAALSEDEAEIALLPARYISGMLRLIYCAEHPEEPAAKRLVAGLARLNLLWDRRITILFGRDAYTGNPKLDNLEKAYAACETDRVVLLDGNLRISDDWIERIEAAWKPGVTAISTSPVATEPRSFWAEVEATDINLNHARWMLAGDQIGVSYCHGKLLGFRRSWLSGTGGFDSLHIRRAEDSALKALVQAEGGKIRLLEHSFEMPLGKRSMRDVLNRNLRWRQLRAQDVPGVYLIEVLKSLWMMMLNAVVLGWALGMPSGVLPMLVAIVWYAVEVATFRASGLGWAWRVPGALVVRDLAEPLLWIIGWLPLRYRWRGRRLSEG